jgi:limonene-1,2-epoxide hydrolase
MSRIEKVERMVGHLTEENWEAMYPFFTEDLFYKVGANPPMHGAKAAAEYLASFYTIIKPAAHEVRGAWELEDGTVIIEMDAKYNRIADGKLITVPCCDVYRFEGDLIKEWRVYPDVADVFK